MKKLAIICFMIPIFLKAFSQHYDNFKVSDLDSGQQFVRELGKPGMSYIEKTKKKRTFSIFASNRILSGISDGMRTGYLIKKFFR